MEESLEPRKRSTEARLVGFLRRWMPDSQAVVESGRTIEAEIVFLLEWYICGVIPFGPDYLGGWWSDGVIHLEIKKTEADRIILLGVTWIGSLGVAPFELEVVLDPEDDTQFRRSVFRLGMLDDQGKPLVCRQDRSPFRVMENRPRCNRDWAMAVELTPSPEN